MEEEKSNSSPPEQTDTEMVGQNDSSLPLSDPQQELPQEKEESQLIQKTHPAALADDDEGFKVVSHRKPKSKSPKNPSVTIQYFNIQQS